jgi:ribonuclease HI
MPANFINLLFEIGRFATTQVMINGFLSNPYRVTRGFRQGCPLSCIAFDLAIEPLACMIRNSDIEGFDIPGKAERLVTMLFADDTSCYLSASDSFHQLKAEILEPWCLASGAKFNIAKTVIIPIGSKEYRERVIETRQIGPRDEPIPTDIRIAEEKEPIRILGGWVGNKIDPNGPWVKVLDDVASSSERWNRSSPTIEGRKLIIQMVVAGKTQYLHMVNGMPKEIETKLTKEIRRFMNEYKKQPRISQKAMQAPRELGGRNLFDLETQEEAIQLMWLKGYLASTEKRHTWAHLTDDILRRATRKKDRKLEQKFRNNTFLQAWKVNKNKLPKSGEIKKLLTVAERNGIIIEKPTREIAMEMPAWYHKYSITGFQAKLFTKPSKCLRFKHNCRTISDLITICERGTIPAEEQHRRHRNCECDPCTSDRHHGCENPIACINEAKRILDGLPPDWDPRRIPARTADGEVDSSETFTFKAPEEPVKPAEAYRVTFTTEEPRVTLHLPRRQTEEYEWPNLVTVYTDGSCKDNGFENARAGSGIFFGHGHPKNKALRLPQMVNRSNQAAEVLAVIEAMRIVGDKSDIRIISDSKYVRDNLTTNLEKNENTGWYNVSNAKLFRLATVELRKREGNQLRTSFEWVKGHSGNEGNEEADRKADEGADKVAPDWLNIVERYGINPRGVRLQSLTRRLAYRAIRARKMMGFAQRKATARNLEYARAAVEEVTGKQPTDEKLWSFVGSKTHTMKHKQFLWKIAHDAYKVGQYWKNIPNHEERATCGCGAGDGIESMRHIMTECQYPGQKELWRLAGKLWERKGRGWPYMTPGLIIGSDEVSFPSGDDPTKPDVGATRLFRLLVVETAYLIWLMRNERVIQHGNAKMYSNAEIRNRLKTAINLRLTRDRLLTNRHKYGTKSINPHLVKSTWSGLLEEEEHLPRGWMTTSTSGVLVSIELRDNG